MPSIYIIVSAYRWRGRLNIIKTFSSVTSNNYSDITLSFACKINQGYIIKSHAYKIISDVDLIILHMCAITYSIHQQKYYMTEKET